MDRVAAIGREGRVTQNEEKPHFHVLFPDKLDPVMEA